MSWWRCKWVMSRTKMSHVKHRNEACHTHRRHVTPMAVSSWPIHLRHAIQPCVWHDSFLCVTRLIPVWYDSFMCVTWLIPVCDMPDVCVLHDSFIRVMRLIHVYDTTVVHVYDVTHWYLKHKRWGHSRRACDLTHSCKRHDVSMCTAWLGGISNTSDGAIYDVRVTWLIHVCAMTYPCVRNDSVVSQTQAMAPCTTCVWLDSFTYVCATTYPCV